jgi:formylglycine-generating enzyme required for sulfatase activity
VKKRLSVLILMILYAQILYADAYIKLMCDESGSDVYVNSEIVGTYDDMPLEFILPSGEHLLEIKKEYGDESYGYYRKTIKAGRIDVKVPVNASLETTFPESYYFRNANSIEGANNYLEIYPNGKYAKKLKDFIEVEYVKKAITIENAREYIAKYPNGRYGQEINAFIEKAYADKAITIRGAEEYLSEYPQGKYRAKVEGFIEQEHADKAITLKAAERYVERYPEGKYITKIRKFVEQEYARNATTIKGAEVYIGKYPSRDNRKGIIRIKEIISPLISNIYKNMVLVNKGEFHMGSEEGLSDERPVHLVRLTYDFYVGKYEVTQKEYKEIIGNNPSSLKGAEFPVSSVTWWDAIKYCNALNKYLGLPLSYDEITGYLLDKNGVGTRDVTEVKGFRLPTEAEWEYSVRGGNQSKNYTYSGSNDINDVAWVSSYDAYPGYPVGTKLANELGLYDMDGGVIEWCQDEYSPSAYLNHAKINPVELFYSQPDLRVARGRYYSSDSWDRFTRRYPSPGKKTDPPYSYLGFRLFKTDYHGFRGGVHRQH